MLSMALVGAILAASPASSRDVGKWRVDVDPGRVIVSQRADAEWSGTVPRLVLRCRVVVETAEIKFIKHTNRIKEAYLFYGPGLPAEGDFAVRFGGDEPPKKYTGEKSEDGKSLFVRGKLGNLDPFLRSLLGHSKVTLVLTPKGREPLPDVSFDLTQLDQALAEWREGCPIKE
jgi:hypothetical protein